MKIEIVKNKYINSIFLLMLFSASVHMLILFYMALSRGDLYILNYFNILDLDIFLPNLFQNNFLSNLSSFIFSGIIYFVILKLNSGEK